MTILKMQLEQIICERRQQLISYAQTPNAKDGYIQKENKLIQSLTEIYNGIILLEYQDLWKEVENRLKIFKKMDANFSGLHLDLRFRELGLLSHQSFNLYEDGL